MSNISIELNKLSLNSNRDSFSHRICDDLCEVLLSYLSFEDKIRFVCFLKQWKKLIFNKQFIIEVTQRSRGDKIYGLSKLLKVHHLDMFAFESLLKKCHFINQIMFNKIDYISFQNRGQVLQSITKYSNNLKKISIDFIGISEDIIKRFGIKFGPKLITIHFNARMGQRRERHSMPKDNFKLLFRLCPKLEQVFDVRIDALIDGNKKLLPKLTKIGEIYDIDTTDEKEIKEIFDGYKDTLKHLNINLEPEFVVVVMRGISDLIRLESLKLVFSFDFDIIQMYTFVENVRLIADKCTQIKHLAFINLDMRVLHTISYFTQIQSLEISLAKCEESHPIHVKSLNGCKKLTKLKIKFGQIDDHFFEDINLYLPQLTHLIATTNHHISDNSLQSLSKLKNLKSVVFESCYNSSRSKGSPSITDSGIRDFIDKCPSIQSIDLKRGPNISYKTIDTLIALALRKPRIDFYYFFQSIENWCFIPLNDIENNKSVPGNINLTIIYFNNNYSKRNITQKFST